MNFSFETERLKMRPLVETDFQHLRTLHSDPEVMRYISDGVTRTEGDTRLTLEKSLFTAAENPGMGVWMAEVGGAVVGNFLLRLPVTANATDGVEIGFSLIPSAWGKGYAKEGGQVLIEHAFNRLSIARVLGLLDPKNHASRKVLSRLGLASVGMVAFKDPISGAELPTELMVLTREHWNCQR